MNSKKDKDQLYSKVVQSYQYYLHSVTRDTDKQREYIGIKEIIKENES